MKLVTTLAVVVNLLCIINARSISFSPKERRDGLAATNSPKSSSGDTQKTSKEISVDDEKLSNASKNAVRVTNLTGDTVTTIHISQSLRNKILDGVKKATQQKDLSTLLDSVTGILGSDNLSPSNPDQTPSLNSSSGQGRPLNPNNGAKTPNGSASIAGSSPNASGLNVGQSCPCSCLCGSGMIPNGSANNASSTLGSSGQMIAGKGVILSDGECGCSCNCPQTAFSNAPGMSSPNSNIPLTTAIAPALVPANSSVVAAPAAAPAQGQSPNPSLPVIISQQTPGQSAPSPIAAPQAQGQSSNLSQPPIISQQNPGQSAPPPVAAPQAQGQSSNLSQPPIISQQNPGQSASPPVAAPQVQGQSSNLSQPPIISQQNPGQSAPPPVAAPQVQGQSSNLSQPPIISQQNPGQSAPPPAAVPAAVAPQAQGQSLGSSNPNIASNPAQAANKPSAPQATPSIPIAVSPPASTPGPAQAQAAEESGEDPFNIQSFSLTSSLNLGNLAVVPTSVPGS